MQEEWRPIVGWEDWYSVSSWGHVRREREGRRTFAGRQLNNWLNRGGYVEVGLTRGSHDSLKFFRVHQLVARAFLGDPPHGARGINHINGIKTDNRVENLEWATAAANSANAVSRGATVNCGRHTGHKRGDKHHARLHPEVLARGASHGNAKLTDDAVRDILTSSLKQAELASKYGVSQTLISAVRRRLIWQHVVI